MADILKEVKQHYQMWTEDNEKRLGRKNGWNDITDAYWGRLPEDWPYETRIVDPRIRTSIIEKNGRLINNKLRGKLVPREGGDMIKARLNNTILDYQWETANHNGSMMMKLEITDQDTRLYASKFAYVYWRYEVDEKGEVLFDGNEMMPLDIRDCGIDPSASHIRDAKWFQMRTWDKFEDLWDAVDAQGKPLYKNLGKVKRMLEEKLANTKSSTNTDYQSRVKQLKGLEDRTGQDLAFPVIKKVIEFRKDKFITFLPEHDVIIKEEDNPYAHKKIPISQNRYYPLQDDPLGESEVEPVLPLWLAIQATICSFMDEVILKMRPPLVILENAVQIETIQYGPEAQWLVSDMNAIREMKGFGESLQYFQTSYQTLVSAFNVAMGDLSAQNVSGLDPFSNDPKTATEVKQTMRQQNMRDQKNQNDLAEFIKDIMMMWLSNNKQFLFSSKEKEEYLVRIVGQDQFNYFKRAGMADTEVSDEVMIMIRDIVEQNPNISDVELEQLLETGSMPKYPIIQNPKEKDPEKIVMKPKMRISEFGDVAEVSIVPADLDGTFDYIADVKSMASGASEEMTKAKQSMFQLFTTNPTVLQLLLDEGYKPAMKELLEESFSDAGINDPERFFTKVQQDVAGAGQMGGAVQNQPVNGLSGVPQANTPISNQQQMAGPQSAGFQQAANV